MHSVPSARGNTNTASGRRNSGRGSISDQHSLLSGRGREREAHRRHSQNFVGQKTDWIYNLLLTDIINHTINVLLLYLLSITIIYQ